MRLLLEQMTLTVRCFHYMLTTNVFTISAIPVCYEMAATRLDCFNDGCNDCIKQFSPTVLAKIDLNVNLGNSQ